MIPDERALLHAQERHDAALAECSICSGSGLCVTCDGSGARWDFTWQYILDCPDCNGYGVCRLCDGSGWAA